MAGFDVQIIDINGAAVESGLTRIGKNLDHLVSKSSLSVKSRNEALTKIHGNTSYDGLVDSDIVIEAATEDYRLKTRILREVARVVGREVIIASNTSSISITKLASEFEAAERFIGMHFFNPVPRMELVEIICGMATDKAVATAVEEFAKKLGKTPISVKNSPGFVVNRILCPMINEAFFVLGEGLASAEQIDEGMRKGSNQPIGPLALADLIGLDTLLAVMEVLYAEFADPKYRPAMLMREMVAAGYLGRKTGRGVYVY